MKIFNSILLACMMLFQIYVKAQTVTPFMGIAHNDWGTTFTNQTEDIDKVHLSLPQFGIMTNDGRMYISEMHKIRLVNGTRAYNRAGKLGQPTFAEGYVNATGINATFRTPSGLEVDADNNLYIVDYDNHCVRKLDKFTTVANAQPVSTFVGANPTQGLPGFGTEGSADGQGTAARFSYPRDIVKDNSGNFYVTDGGNFTIRKITNGFVATLAGTAGSEGTTDGTGAAARFGDPYGIALLNNNTLVVTDRWNTCIRTVNTVTGETKTIAGPTNGGVSMHRDGTLAEARFVNPRGVVVVAGIIYVADENTIRRIDINANSVTTFAGNKSQVGTTNGTGDNASFTEIIGLFTDGKGYLYSVESSDAYTSNLVRKISIDDLIPVAVFEASKQAALVNEVITITDKSKGANLNAWKYNITPSTFTITEGSLTTQNFKVQFSQVGFYTISLEIDGEYGNNSITVEDYIAISTTGGGVNVEKIKGGLFSLYPNPSNGSLSIKIPETWGVEGLTVEIFSQNGQVLYNGVFHPSLDLHNLSDGLYFMVIRGENINAAQRFIINR